MLQVQSHSRVSTHSRLKAAGGDVSLLNRLFAVSTHSRLKAAGDLHSHDIVSFRVSTHSRLKAAGRCYSGSIGSDYCFNTQPPEGGWT